MEKMLIAQLLAVVELEKLKGIRRESGYPPLDHEKAPNG
jgi:hypothetical protein